MVAREVRVFREVEKEPAYNSGRLRLWEELKRPGNEVMVTYPRVRALFVCFCKEHIAQNPKPMGLHRRV